jgi:hypothetical protein
VFCTKLHRVKTILEKFDNRLQVLPQPPEQNNNKIQTKQNKHIPLCSTLQQSTKQNKNITFIQQSTINERKHYVLFVQQSTK